MGDIMKYHSVFVVSILKGGAALCSFLYSVFLMRKLGADDAGIYFLCYSVISVCVVAGKFGMDNTMLSYSAINANLNKWGVVRSVYIKSNIISLLHSLILSGLIVLFAICFSNEVFHKKEIVVVLVFMAITVIPISSLYIQSEFLRGANSISGYILLSGGGVSLISLLLLIIYQGNDLFVVVCIYIFSALLIWFGGVFYIELFFKGKKYSEEYVGYKELYIKSRPVFVAVMMSIIVMHSGNLILGVYETGKNIAVYNAAMKVSLIGNLAVNSFSTQFTPLFARYYKGKEYQKLHSAVKKNTIIMSLFIVPIMIYIFIYPEIFMKLFGQEFVDGSIIVSVLLVGEIFNVVTGPISPLLLMTENEKYMQNNVFFVGVLSIVLYCIVIPGYGVIGAAVCYSFCNIIKNIIAYILVKQRLGFWPIGYKKTVS